MVARQVLLETRENEVRRIGSEGAKSVVTMVAAADLEQAKSQPHHLTPPGYIEVFVVVE